MQIKNLTIKYGEKIAIKNLSFDLLQGKVNCILGQSGSGKTSILNAIASLVPYEGNIEGQGKVSLCFQQPTLIPTINCYKNCEIVLQNIANKEKLICDIFEKLSITECLYKLPSKISGGQASRVSLARALCYGGDTLMLDESFRSLDYKLKWQLLGILPQLTQKNTTILFVTHDLDEAVMVSDRIIMLENSSHNAKVNIIDVNIQHNQRTWTNTKILDIKNKLIDIAMA